MREKERRAMTSMAAFMKRREERYEKLYEMYLQQCAMGESVRAAQEAMGEALSAMDRAGMAGGDAMLDGGDGGAGADAQGGIGFVSASEMKRLRIGECSPEELASVAGLGGSHRKEAMEMVEDLAEMGECAVAILAEAMGGRPILTFGELKAAPRMGAEQARKEAAGLAPRIAKFAQISLVLEGFCRFVARQGLAGSECYPLLLSAMEREGLGLACEAAQEGALDAGDGHSAVVGKKPKSV